MWREYMRVNALGIFLVAVLVPTAMASSSGEVPLTKGWDIFNQPLDYGTAKWNYDGGEISFEYELVGAEPNHEYTVGVHIFNKDDPTKIPSQVDDKARIAFDNFPGERKKGDNCITREGNEACVEAYDFVGTLKTNEMGNGKLVIPPMPIYPYTYYVQFTIRNGKCPVEGGSNCAAVYRSGEQFAKDFAEIKTGTI
jgi:hypothetical protein